MYFFCPNSSTLTGGTLRLQIGHTLVFCPDDKVADITGCRISPICSKVFPSSQFSLFLQPTHYPPGILLRFSLVSLNVDSKRLLNYLRAKPFPVVHFSCDDTNRDLSGFAGEPYHIPV